ncbi:MAG: penicillin-binding transpeptidase domain-containing protein [Candidatus Solibacter sp.]
MLRRHAIASLFAAGAWGKAVDRCLEGVHGAIVLAERKSRRLITAHSPELAGTLALPPGSTMKPLVLQTMWERGMLHATDRLPCPGELRINGRSLACSHPPLPGPVGVREAIAYSCNCFVAHYAARFHGEEWTRAMEQWGLASRSGWFGEGEGSGRVWNAPVALQALGEDGVLATPAALAMAYWRLANRAADPVLAGMRDAVEAGTARRARVAGMKVAGKTGSTRTAQGVYTAWFAGFTDAAVIVVAVQGKSGGGDAAPVAGRALEAHARGMA